MSSAYCYMQNCAITLPCGSRFRKGNKKIGFIEDRSSKQKKLTAVTKNYQGRNFLDFS